MEDLGNKIFLKCSKPNKVPMENFQENSALRFSANGPLWRFSEASGISRGVLININISPNISLRSANSPSLGN
jgi:hypothetical protein